jgi:predicted ATPase
VAECGDGQLIDALDRLTDANLILREGAPPHTIFLFKHALIQEAAYGTLLRQTRRDLHARIAKALNENFPHIRDTQPEILARHFFEAGLTEPAIEWWSKAGERAIRGSAYVEAIAHLERAIDLTERQVDSPEQRLVRIRLQTNHGYASLHGRGQTSPKTIASFCSCT